MKVFAYCRVSMETQRLDRQEDAINDYVKRENLIIDKWFMDKITGKTFDRKNYNEMREIADKDTIIIIKELDRLGRDYDLIKEEYKYFIDKGVKLIFIDMPMISSNLSEKQGLDQRLISDVVFQLLCWLSAKEREKISNRTKEGMQSAKNRGVRLGKKSFEYTKEQIDTVISMYFNYKGKEIIQKTNLKPSTYYNLLKNLKKEGKIKKQKLSGKPSIK